MIEPLKEFHNDKVRRLGRELGLASSITDRHPFPGPGLLNCNNLFLSSFSPSGLAIRVLCSNGEPNIGSDFSETQVLTRLVVNYSAMVAREHALLNRWEGWGVSVNFECKVCVSG